MALLARSNIHALLAEFVGTFALVFCAVAAAASTDHSVGLLGAAAANGLVIAVMVASLAGVSGAHFNPAVTWALVFSRHVRLRRAIGYWAVQIAGALAGAWTARAVLDPVALGQAAFGTPTIGVDVTVERAFAMEAILTFVLMFTIYGAAVFNKRPQIPAMFIALAVALGVLLGGPVSGGGMNPARWFGPAQIGGGLGNGIVWTLGPVLGATGAAIFWMLLASRSNEPA